VVPSLAAIAPDDWTELYHLVTDRLVLNGRSGLLALNGEKPMIELNLGCPNTGSVPMITMTELRRFCGRFRVSVKLPVVNHEILLDMALDAVRAARRGFTSATRCPPRAAAKAAGT